MTPPSPTAGALPELVEAYRGRRPERLPIWFMRQAGRSLPEYRRARAGLGMLEACTTPDLVAEITAQPVRRYGVDAGIFYSDIVVPLYLAGVDVTIETGVGPVFADPVCDDAALARLTAHEPADLNVIIGEEKLKEEETRKFLNNSFRDGTLKTTGTDIDKILPPASRFGGGTRAAKKQSVIARLMQFFEKYLGLV